MNLLIAILLYLGAVSSADQVNQQVIDENQTEINRVIDSGILINTLESGQ